MKTQLKPSGVHVPQIRPTADTFVELLNLASQKCWKVEATLYYKGESVCLTGMLVSVDGPASSTKWILDCGACGRVVILLDKCLSITVACNIAYGNSKDAHAGDPVLEVSVML